MVLLLINFQLLSEWNGFIVLVEIPTERYILMSNVTTGNVRHVKVVCSRVPNFLTVRTI